MAAYLCGKANNYRRMSKPILSIHQVSKFYGPVQALRSVSFEVPEGCVFGVLGPNGSGKTTLLGILLDVLRADQGHFEWFGGMPRHEARRKIGSLLETPNFYHYLSAVKNLEINARIRERGEDDIDRVLDIVRLSPRKHSKFSTYSLGMKQRLAIANALLGRPKVLLLDEPTNGLDPEGIAEIRELIRSLIQEGITVIMASHLLDEVEKVCTHAAVLKKGSLLISGSVQEAFQHSAYVELGATDVAMLRTMLQEMQGIRIVGEENGLLRVELTQGMQPDAINRACFEKGIVLNHIALRKKSLEAHFMELTRGGSVA
jgi:ABC-type multidrug transport system ATPase subunit